MPASQHSMNWTWTVLNSAFLLRLLLWFLLAVILCNLHRLRRTRVTPSHWAWPIPRALGQRGAAMVDFAMVMPFYVMLCLCLAQLTLWLHGFLIVQYAAFVAARSAIVQPDNSPARPQMAAAMACLNISPAVGPPRTSPAGVLLVFASGGLTDPRAARRWGYAMDNTAVTTRVSEAPLAGENGVAFSEDVTVDVTYRFAMTIPWANRLLGGQRGDALTGNHYFDDFHATCTLVRLNEYCRKESW